MNREKPDRKLDQWLDRALSDYGAAEPRPGLEARILAELRTRLKSRTSRGFRWQPAWMPAALAVIVIFVVVLFIAPGKPPVPDPSRGNDLELLRGVDRQLNKAVPSALEPALVLTREMTKRQ